MSDLSLTTKLKVTITLIVTNTRLGLDERRYAEARRAYETLKETLPKEKVSELWAQAREAHKAGDQTAAGYWLKLFGDEMDRRYAEAYRKRPKVKKARAAYMVDYRQRAEPKSKKAQYMADYQARPEVKKSRAAYMKTWRANRKGREQ